MARAGWQEALDALLDLARNECGARGLVLVDPRQIPRDPDRGYLGTSGAFDDAHLFIAAENWREALQGAYTAHLDDGSSVIVAVILDRAILVASYPLLTETEKVTAAVGRSALTAILEANVDPFPPGYLESHA